MKIQHAALGLTLLIAGCSSNLLGTNRYQQPVLATEHIALLTDDGYQFKDHNKNNRLDPFEDWRLPANDRAVDLLSRMSVEEKVGQMLHGRLDYIVEGADGFRGIKAEIDFDSKESEHSVREKISEFYVGAFITKLSDSNIRKMVESHNKIQQLAEKTPNAIPVSVSSDPRHHFTEVSGGSHSASNFSQWPETLGLAALDDLAVIEKFAEAVREEYRAVGINMALHPTADLATEPRWARVNSTLGENPDKVASYMETFIATLQNGDTGLSPGGVWGVVKHYTGGGPQENGLDAHFSQGRTQVYPGHNEAAHRKPFIAAFNAGVAGVMPYFSVPKSEQVPADELGIQFNFSHNTLTNMLRQQDKFTGVVLSDWEIVDDCVGACIDGATQMKDLMKFRLGGTPWGLESLTRKERYATAVNAGIDQLGGVDDPVPLLDLIREGTITEARVNQSVLRILQQKFSQGLFENAFAEADAAIALMENNPFTDYANSAQRQSYTLLKNKDDTLPLSPDSKTLVYLYDASEDEISAAKNHGLVITPDIAQADAIVVRAGLVGTGNFSLGLLGAVWLAGELAYLPRDGFRLQEYEKMPQENGHPYCQHLEDARAPTAMLAERVLQQAATSPVDKQGKPLTHNSCFYIGFNTYEALEEVLANKKPAAKVILEVPLRRGVALGNIVDKVDAVLANFGVAYDSFLQILSGVDSPRGKLPLGLPKSTGAVIQYGAEDTPSYQLNPEMTLFPYGYGLRY